MRGQKLYVVWRREESAGATWEQVTGPLSLSIAKGEALDRQQRSETHKYFWFIEGSDPN